MISAKNVHDKILSCLCRGHVENICIMGTCLIIFWRSAIVALPSTHPPDRQDLNSYISSHQIRNRINQRCNHECDPAQPQHVYLNCSARFSQIELFFVGSFHFLNMLLMHTITLFPDMRKRASTRAVLAEIFSNCGNYIPTLPV